MPAGSFTVDITAIRKRARQKIASETKHTESERGHAMRAAD